MNKYAQLLIALILVLSCMLGTIQPVSAQQNHSSGRILGIGAFWPVIMNLNLAPTTLNARLWVTNGLGLEGTLLMVLTVPAVSVIGAGGGLLSKLIDGDFVDIYAGGRMLVVTAQTIYFSVSVTGASGSLGLEISPLHWLALSMDISLWSVLGSSFPIPTGISWVAPVVGLGVHYYF